mgnify:CR=1 FL=1
MVMILNETALSVALPAIMADFDIPATSAQWLLTGFLLTMGVVIPTTGYLFQRFTVRQVFTAAMTSFVTGTLLAFSGGRGSGSAAHTMILVGIGLGAALSAGIDDGSAVLLLGFESADAPVDGPAARAVELCGDLGGSVPDGIRTSSSEGRVSSPRCGRGWRGPSPS